MTRTGWRVVCVLSGFQVFLQLSAAGWLKQAALDLASLGLIWSALWSLVLSLAAACAGGWLP